MQGYTQGLGPFRWFLIICTAVLVGFAFAASGLYASADAGNRAILSVAGSLAPIFFFLLLFDALMNRVQMSEKTESERARFRRYLRIELGAVAILTLSWVPFFYSLLV